MIESASKYTPARGCLSARRAPGRADLPVGLDAQQRVPTGQRVPTSKVDLGRAVDAVYKQAQLASPLILIPRFRTTFNRPDWVWQELREGGRLKRYLQIEKSTTNQRWRAVGKARAGFQQNNKSELKLKASIPAIDYFRFRRMDKHFFDDDANLRSLRRDNPSVDTVYV